jgi:hypothetical protein
MDGSKKIFLVGLLGVMLGIGFIFTFNAKAQTPSSVIQGGTGTSTRPAKGSGLFGTGTSTYGKVGPCSDGQVFIASSSVTAGVACGSVSGAGDGGIVSATTGTTTATTTGLAVSTTTSNLLIQLNSALQALGQLLTDFIRNGYFIGWSSTGKLELKQLIGGSGISISPGTSTTITNTAITTINGATGTIEAVVKITTSTPINANNATGTVNISCATCVTSTVITNLSGIVNNYIVATSTGGGGLDYSTSSQTGTWKIGRNIDTINAAATTTGNLLFASSGPGWVSDNPCAAGQNLRATTTAYRNGWDCATDQSSAGSGTGYSDWVFQVNPSGAAVNTTTPAGANKKIGTNVTFHTLDFTGSLSDSSTTEDAFFMAKTPVFTALNTCTFKFSYFADATTTGNIAVMALNYKNIGENVAYDAAPTISSTSISMFGSVANMHNASTTIATSSIASADILELNLQRRLTESDDVDVSDVRYAGGVVYCTYR